jgi:3-deoxy-D-manno-octulosonic-acid transferase
LPLIYQLLIYLFFAAAWPFLLFHPKLRGGAMQRLGRYPAGTFAGMGRPRIWLHGASAGDLLALAPIIAGLRRHLPQSVLIVSTLTNTGRLMARERLRGVDAITYLPYDLPGATRRAMEAIDPDLLILEYTEIWPNLIRAAKRHGASVALTNGRFSPHRLTSYRWLFRLIGNPLRDIDLFLMREEVEAERALGLGAPLDRVWVTGNTKFDALLSAESSEVEPGLRQAIGEGVGPLWIAGSTHEGEEVLLLGVFSRLRQTYPGLRLCLAPRYLERAGRVLSLARERGFRAKLRTGEVDGDRSDVVVLDTIGELSQAYRLASLVFVGGSFTHRGGQNILEPAAAGKPVLFGPHMDNFYDSVQVLIGRGGIQVRDEDQLYRVLHELLARRDQIAELGEMARKAVQSVRGASDRDVDQLLKLLEERLGRARP